MFGENVEKLIIVVAPDKYKAIARSVTHALSKIENVNAAYWTIKHFEDNEMQLGSKHWVLSIGNPGENRITKDYITFIKIIHDEGGLSYGFDSNKAIVFADETKIDKEKTLSVARDLGLVTASGAATGVVSISLLGTVLLGSLFSIVIPTILIGRYIKNKKDFEKLLNATTALTTDLFLKEGVKEWIIIEKEESF